MAYRCDPPNQPWEHVAVLRRSDDEFRLLLHDFTALWQHTARQLRCAHVAAEPEPIDVRWNAFAAALVDHLCAQAGLEPPSWTQNPSRFLSARWFAGGCFGFERARTMDATPPAFERHSIWMPQHELAAP